MASNRRVYVYQDTWRWTPAEREIMMHQAGFRSIQDDHPEAPEGDDVIDYAHRFTMLEDRFNRMDYQFELLLSSFDALASRVSHLLHHLGQDPAASDLSSKKPSSPERWNQSQSYVGDPLWDAICKRDEEARAAEQKEKDKAHGIIWNTSQAEADELNRWRVQKSYGSGAVRYHLADGSFEDVPYALPSKGGEEAGEPSATAFSAGSWSDKDEEDKAVIMED